MWLRIIPHPVALTDAGAHITNSSVIVRLSNLAEPIIKDDVVTPPLPEFVQRWLPLMAHPALT